MSSARIAAFLLLVAGVRIAPAQTEAGQRIQVKIVAGHLVARCDLVTTFRRIPANILIEYDAPCGLQLHNKAAKALRVDEGGLPITLKFPECKISVDRRELGPQDLYEDLTRLHSTALGDVAVIGTLGAQVLGNYALTFDLAAGVLELAPPKAVSEGAPEPEPGAVILPVSVLNDVVWIPVRYSDSQPAKVALGTSRFDSLVDHSYCESAGSACGDIGPIRADAIDFASYVAWRPANVTLTHPDGALGVIGLNLLQNLRVEVDRVNGFVSLIQTRPPDFPTADRAFFQAMVDEDADALEAWLAANPKGRLAPEGGEALLDLRLDGGGDTASFKRAVEWFDRTRLEDLRTTEALRVIQKLRSAGRKDLAIVAGEVGLAGGRKDRYPDAVHKLHAQLGAILMEEGEGKRARRHLLSAAFGIPDDGLVNLNLGRFYESQKRYRRAFSRYVQAVIKPESAAEALKGLDRVQKALGATEAISVDEIDRLIAGKILGFGAATRFEATPKNSSNRVVVAELFTNADIERGALAGILAFEGLSSHFPTENLVILSYHLPRPKLISLVSPLALAMARSYGVGPLKAFVNGVVEVPGGARKSEREKLYTKIKTVVEDELLNRSKHSIAIDAKLEGDRIVGSVIVQGPKERDTSVQIFLAEKKLLFPGKSGAVIHRMVARAALTKSASGIDWQPKEGKMTIPLSNSIKTLETKNLAFLDRAQSAGGGLATKFGARIDRRQLVVVALLRDRQTLEILQARQKRVTLPSKD